MSSQQPEETEPSPEAVAAASASRTKPAQHASDDLSFSSDDSEDHANRNTNNVHNNDDEETFVTTQHTVQNDEETYITARQEEGSLLSGRRSLLKKRQWRSKAQQQHQQQQREQQPQQRQPKQDQQTPQKQKQKEKQQQPPAPEQRERPQPERQPHVLTTEEKKDDADRRPLFLTHTTKWVATSTAPTKHDIVLVTSSSTTGSAGRLAQQITSPPRVAARGAKTATGDARASSPRHHHISGLRRPPATTLLEELVACPCCRQTIDDPRCRRGTLNEPTGFGRRGSLLSEDDEDEEEDTDSEDNDDHRDDGDEGDILPGGLTGGVKYHPRRILVEGWLHKKGTGKDWLGSRGWKARWARLALARVEGHGGIDLPLLLMYWYPSSDSASTVIVLDSTVVMAVDAPDDAGDNDATQCRFEIRHAGTRENATISATRTFAAPRKARDSWVYAISQALLIHEKQKAAAARSIKASLITAWSSSGESSFSALTGSAAGAAASGLRVPLSASLDGGTINAAPRCRSPSGIADDAWSGAAGVLDRAFLTPASTWFGSPPGSPTGPPVAGDHHGATVPTPLSPPVLPTLSPPQSLQTLSPPQTLQTLSPPRNLQTLSPPQCSRNGIRNPRSPPPPPPPVLATKPLSPPNSPPLPRGRAGRPIPRATGNRSDFLAGESLA